MKTKDILSASEAYTIASQWGSYMRDGDPGSVFYTFPAGEALVQDEEHRKALLAYTDTCLLSSVGSAEELTQLRAYFETAKAQDELVWWTSSSGTIEFQLTREQAGSASHPGRCDDDVDSLRKIPAIAAQLDKIDPSELRKELKEYGAWDGEELADHSENLDRIVWIAANDIAEGQCDPEDEDGETGLHVFQPDHNLCCELCGHGELQGDHGMVPGDGGASGTDFSPCYQNDAVRQMYADALDGLSEFEEDRPDWKLREEISQKPDED